MCICSTALQREHAAILSFPSPMIDSKHSGHFCLPQGPVSAPQNLRLSDIQGTQVTLHWDPVRRSSIMGELKEYKVCWPRLKSHNIKDNIQETWGDVCDHQTVKVILGQWVTSVSWYEKELTPWYGFSCTLFYEQEKKAHHTKHPESVHNQRVHIITF